MWPVDLKNFAGKCTFKLAFPGYPYGNQQVPLDASSAAHHGGYALDHAPEQHALDLIAEQNRR